MNYKLSIFYWAVSFFVLTVSADIQINGFDPLLHDRFTNDASFIGTGYDFSGVALSGDARWATLVSDQVIISSYHFDPLSGAHQYIRFVPGNDPSIPYEERVVVAGQRLGNSDLWIGRLDAPVSNSIAHYRFMEQSLTNSTQFINTLLGEEVYMLGRSPVDHSVHGIGVAADQAVGKNLLDGWQDDFNDQKGTVYDMMFAVENLAGDQNFIQHEARAMSGDSGAPVFRINSGQLELVGINWVSGTGTFGIGARGFTGFTYVGNFASEIDTYIFAIPELSSLLLAGLCGAGMALTGLFRIKKDKK